MARLGYKRVSTEDQHLDNQELGKLDRLFEEKISGKSTARPELMKLIEYARDGDTVVVHSIDRLARSTLDLISVVQMLTDKGATVEFNRERLRFSKDDSDPTAKLMLTMLAAIGEFERGIMLQRQKAGIARAKRDGKYTGRVRKVDWDAVRRDAEDGMAKVDIAKKHSISRQMVHKILNVV